MKKIITILITPFIVFSQDVFIKPLSESINTNHAEINFIQKDDTTAYFTVVIENEGRLESNIYVARFLNGSWSQKRYSKYNSEYFSKANISFSDDFGVFFSKCSLNLTDCKVCYLKEDNKGKKTYEISSLSSERFFNTQAFVAQHSSHRVLYFVSDRKGGFGGLDIWLSIIDNNGNFGIPVNAGANINSIFDDITPFYNYHDSKMYFSSNRKNGLGGFDIYKSEGKLNLWKEPENVKELNTKKDEMYLTYYDRNHGYFSSNRKGSTPQEGEHCCNDIFSFHYPCDSRDTIKPLSKVQKYLPLNLYFHNDEPDSNTLRPTTQKTYKESYISYFIMKDEYEQKNANLDNFFEGTLQENFNHLNQILEILLFEIKTGINVEIKIRGYSSPLYSVEYNKMLSQRRIASFVNYLIQFKNSELKTYIDSKRLTISELPLGETNAPSKVSDDPKNKKKSIYSLGAMLERKIEIVEVILKE